MVYKMFTLRFPFKLQKLHLIIVMVILAVFLVGCGAPAATNTATNTNQGNANQEQKGSASSEQKAQSAAQTGTLTKGTFKIVSVGNNEMGVRYIYPQEKNGQTATLVFTPNTTFQPDQNSVTTGKIILVIGTVNAQSFTAQEVQIVTETYSSGDIVSIEGDTIQMQSTYGHPTVHLTADTVFVKHNLENGQMSSASRSDIKVGIYIVSEGPINDDGSINATEVQITEGKAPDKPKKE